MALELHCRLKGYRWKRYVPCLVFIGVLTSVQVFAIVLGSPLFLKKTFESLASLRHRGSSNGTGPIHVLLVSYARTGSSFVGDLLQSLPCTFYHFEPLHFIHGPVLNDSFVDEGRTLLDNVYRCNISAIKGFMQWQKAHKRFMKFKRSIKYWRQCSKSPNSCFNNTYMDSYCRKHNLIAVKTIRLTLSDAAKMFQTHPHLNLKIIYLSRDPRGTVNSRTKPPVTLWCDQDPTCANAKEFCSTLSKDMMALCSLSKERPFDFHVFRYEDLSLDPYRTTTRLVNFLGFQFLPRETEDFLRSHTSVLQSSRVKYESLGVAYAYSTFRNSSITATSWRQQMAFDRVTHLQQDCQTALKGFGYHSYSSLGTLRSNKNLDIPLDSAVESFCGLT